MKVLQVMAGAEQGGAETAFVDTCVALKEAGIKVQVAARGNALRSPKLEQAGIKIHHLPFGGAIDIYTPWKLKQIIRVFNPDIVQTWMSRGSAKTPANPEKYLKVSRLGGYYNLKYYKDTDYFIANTPDIRSYLVREGIENSRAVHINNFALAETALKPVTKADLDTPEDAVAVLALARLHENKALDVLIKSIVDLPNIHLWLAGEGPLRMELETLADDLGVAERVHFLGWRDDRAALMQACDICCVPSRHEPFGNVFVQAWAAKVPLVTSNSEGPSQYVHDGEDSLVFAIDDVDGLKNALARLSADKALQTKISETGYRRYLQEFTREKTVEAYLRFYQDILARDRRTR